MTTATAHSKSGPSLDEYSAFPTSVSRGGGFWQPHQSRRRELLQLMTRRQAIVLLHRWIAQIRHVDPEPLFEYERSRGPATVDALISTFMKPALKFVNGRCPPEQASEKEDKRATAEIVDIIDEKGTEPETDQDKHKRFKAGRKLYEYKNRTVSVERLGPEWQDEIRERLRRFADELRHVAIPDSLRPADDAKRWDLAQVIAFCRARCVDMVQSQRVLGWLAESPFLTWHHDNVSTEPLLVLTRPKRSPRVVTKVAVDAHGQVTVAVELDMPPEALARSVSLAWELQLAVQKKCLRFLSAGALLATLGAVNRRWHDYVLHNVLFLTEAIHVLPRDDGQGHLAFAVRPQRPALLGSATTQRKKLKRKAKTDVKTDDKPWRDMDQASLSSEGDDERMMPVVAPSMQDGDADDSASDASVRDGARSRSSSDSGTDSESGSSLSSNDDDGSLSNLSSSSGESSDLSSSSASSCCSGGSTRCHHDDRGLDLAPVKDVWSFKRKRQPRARILDVLFAIRNKAVPSRTSTAVAPCSIRHVRDESLDGAVSSKTFFPKLRSFVRFRDLGSSTRDYLLSHFQKQQTLLQQGLGLDRQEQSPLRTLGLACDECECVAALDKMIGYLPRLQTLLLHVRWRPTSSKVATLALRSGARNVVLLVCTGAVEDEVTRCSVYLARAVRAAERARVKKRRAEAGKPGLCNHHNECDSAGDVLPPLPRCMVGVLMGPPACKGGRVSNDDQVLDSLGDSKRFTDVDNGTLEHSHCPCQRCHKARLKEDYGGESHQWHSTWRHLKTARAQYDSAACAQFLSALAKERQETNKTSTATTGGKKAKAPVVADPYPDLSDLAALGQLF